MGRKRNKHRRCVQVAPITHYQSSRRQQRVPGMVTFTYQDDDPSTKCLRRLKNLNFKLAFTIDINHKSCLRTISPSFLTSLRGNWQAKRDLIEWCFAKLSNENIYCEVQVLPNTFTGFLAALAPSSNGLLTEGWYAG